jgi:hypothetical protein
MTLHQWPLSTMRHPNTDKVYSLTSPPPPPPPPLALPPSMCWGALPVCTCFYLMSTVLQNFALRLWRVSACMCQIRILEMLLCWMFTLKITTDLPLDALLRLRQSVGYCLFCLKFVKLIMLIVGNKMCFVSIAITGYVLLFFIYLCLWLVISSVFSYVLVLSL